MNIPTEFRGKVYFYLHPQYGLSVFQTASLGGEYVLVGESPALNVTFADPRAAMAESLDAAIEKERAESAHRIAVMLDMKRSA